MPDNYRELSQHDRPALRRMLRRHTLVCAFWERANLFVPTVTILFDSQLGYVSTAPRTSSRMRHIPELVGNMES